MYTIRLSIAPTLLLLAAVLSLMTGCQNKPAQNESSHMSEQETRALVRDQALEQLNADTTQPRLSSNIELDYDPDLDEKIAKMKPRAHNDDPIEITGVNLTNPLYPTMVAKSKQLFAQRNCGQCHSLDGSASTASTIKGITQRRRPEWIVNMLYFADPVKTITPEELQRVSGCPVRAQGQQLTFIQARDMLEYFRHIDGEK